LKGANQRVELEKAREASEFGIGGGGGRGEKKKSVKVD